LLAGIVAGYGCGASSTSAGKVDESARRAGPSGKGGPNQEASADDPNAPPAFTTTAEQLAKAFRTDEQAAKGKYVGKWLVIEGEYGEAYYRSGGVLFFKELDGFAPVGGHFDDTEWPKFDGLTKGQKIKIKAFCDLSSHKICVHLDKCKLLEVGPDPAIIVTAFQLTKDYAANKDAVRARFEWKEVLVEGTALRVDSGNFLTIVLVGFDETAVPPVRVEAEFDFDRRTEAAKVKKGDKIKIKGTVSLSLEKPGLRLYPSKIVK
jgi:hypothetical protein